MKIIMSVQIRSFNIVICYGYLASFKDHIHVKQKFVNENIGKK